MKCPEREFIEHYIQGQLELQGITDFEAHLQTCKNCQAIVAEARENEKLLAALSRGQARSLPNPATRKFPQSNRHKIFWGSGIV